MLYLRQDVLSCNVSIYCLWNGSSLGLGQIEHQVPSKTLPVHLSSSPSKTSPVHLPSSPSKTSPVKRVMVKFHSIYDTVLSGSLQKSFCFFKGLSLQASIQVHLYHFVFPDSSDWHNYLAMFINGGILCILKT